MTSYKALQKAKDVQERNEKEEERILHLGHFSKDIEEYMKESSQVASVLSDLKVDEDENQLMETAIQSILSELEKNFVAYSHQDYRNTPHYDRFPDGNVLVTNDADKFASLIDTKESRFMECTGSGYGASYFSYEQYVWKPILNEAITIINYGDEYEAFKKVDFNVDKPYLLFGWRNDWDETDYRRDAFEEKDGKQVETSHNTRYVSTPKIKRFTILIYMPSEDVMYFKNQELAETAGYLRKQRHKRENPGFFARLFA